MAAKRRRSLQMAALLAGCVVDGHKACGSSYACSSYLAAARQQACSAGPGCGGIAKQNDFWEYQTNVRLPINTTYDVREPQGDSKARRAETGTRRAAAEGDSCAPSLLPCANRLAGVLAGVLALLLAACRGRLLRGRQVKKKIVEGRRHAAGSVQLHSARRRQGAQLARRQTPYPPRSSLPRSRPYPRRLTR